MSQSTDEAPRRAGPPRGLLGMVALVVLCELFVTAREIDFSRHEAWDWRVTGREATAKAVGAEVLCLGDSQVKFGVLPAVLEARLGRPAFNLSVIAGQAPASYFLLRRALEAGARPGAIVLDFEPGLLNASIRRNARFWPELLRLGELVELSWEVRDARFLADMAVARALPSYRDRMEIRSNIMAALRGETPIARREIGMIVRNETANRGAVAMPRDPAREHVNVGPWGNPLAKPWAANPVNERYLRKFFRLAESRQIPVFCLAMPVYPTLRAKFEATDLDRNYTRLLASFQARFPNVSVVDARHSGYEHEAFFDALHLGSEGASAYTDQLAELLRRRVWEGEPGGRWIAMAPPRGAPADVKIEDSLQSLAVIDQSDAARRR